MSFTVPGLFKIKGSAKVQSRVFYTYSTVGAVLVVDAANTGSNPGSGSSWNDLSGKGNHLTLSGTSRPSSTTIGFSTSGASRSSFNSVPASNMTMLLWLKLTDVALSETMMSLNRSSTNIANEALFSMAPGGVPSFFDYSSTTAYNFSGNASASIGQWTQVAVVKNGLNASLYMNGANLGNGSSGINVTYGNATFMIGNDNRDLTTYLHATMSLAMVFTSSLTATDISNNYLAMKSRFGL